jgi:hypothetical protein
MLPAFTTPREGEIAAACAAHADYYTLRIAQSKGKSGQ